MCINWHSRRGDGSCVTVFHSAKILCVWLIRVAQRATCHIVVPPIQFVSCHFRFFFFYCSAGYTITCTLINTYVNRMGPYAMAERSDDFTFTSIRLQLRHMADWNDNSVAVSHLHHIFGFGRKFTHGLCDCKRSLAQNWTKSALISQLFVNFSTISTAVSTAFSWSRHLYCESRRRHAGIYAGPLFLNVRSFLLCPNCKR